MNYFIFILSLFLFSPISWSAVKNFTPVDTALDANNQDTNYSANKSFHIVNNDAYIMRFDLSSIKGQKAAYAHMYMWTNRAFRQDNNYYRILKDFVPSEATWNMAASGVNWNTPGALDSSADYTVKNTAQVKEGAEGYYIETDITALVNDALNAGNILDLMYRSPTGKARIGVNMAHHSTFPPYLTISTGKPDTPNLWYVRDGGGKYGQTSTTCNGTANVVFTGNNGPNCAVNSPDIIVGNGNAPQWTSGDIMYIDGDSDTSYAFTVSNVTTIPEIGDEYSNNGVIYTVNVSLPAGQGSGIISMSGLKAPTSSGNLTLVPNHGKGSSLIIFSAVGPAQAMYQLTHTLNIPEGMPNQQTKIIGIETHWPQLWSNGYEINMINASEGYVDLKNLDITTHNNCITHGPVGPNGQTIGEPLNADDFPYVCTYNGHGPFSVTGIYWGGTGLTIENVNVHGLENGMNNGKSNAVIGNITLTNVKVFGNSSQGAIIGSGAKNQIMNGTISLINSQIDFNGCGERYPLQDNTDVFNNIATAGFSKSVDNESNYYNCFGQETGGYGDGFGFGDDGNANAGNWTIIGSSVSFNTQDGVDTLHGTGNGIEKFFRSRFEGNAGQQLKLNAKIENVENNLINGDCARWLGAPESSTTTGSTKNGKCASGFVIAGPNQCYRDASVCRANGDVNSMAISAGSQTYFYGNTISANGIAILTEGSTCDDKTGLHVKNNIINGGAYANYDPTIGSADKPQLISFIYNSGNDGDGNGSCGSIVPDEDYNIVYNTKNNNHGCKGAHDLCGTSPGFQNPIPMGTISGDAATYYHGTAMTSLESLSNSSPAIDAAKIIPNISPLDYNKVNRGTKWDIGAMQYSDVSQTKK